MTRGMVAKNDTAADSYADGVVLEMILLLDTNTVCIGPNPESVLTDIFPFVAICFKQI